MREMQELRAAPRARQSKGSARQLRRRGYVPGILYGGTGEPVPVQVDERTLIKHHSTGTLLSTLFLLDFDGAKTRVIPRQIQLDPVTDRPLHVDFLRLEEGARIALDIPVRFHGQPDSPGLKLGGVLNIVRHTVELYCPVDAIPEFIEANLSGLEIGDSVHISAFTLPEGVRPVIQQRDFTVATIAPPTQYVEEVAAAAVAAVEGEAAAAPVEGEAGAAPGGPAPAAATTATPEKGKAPEKK